MRRRRALYRATHRGSKELDFLLGRFAAETVETMTDTEISVMERLIETPDPDIAVALFEGNSLGEPVLDALMMRHCGAFTGSWSPVKSCQEPAVTMAEDKVPDPAGRPAARPAAARSRAACRRVSTPR